MILEITISTDLLWQQVPEEEYSVDATEDAFELKLGKELMKAGFTYYKIYWKLLPNGYKIVAVGDDGYEIINFDDSMIRKIIDSLEVDYIGLED